MQETTSTLPVDVFYYQRISSEVSMHITVNGEQTSILEGTSLLSLIESRGLDPQAVVAELNLDIVPAGTFADVRLNPGDSLELLQFVGGG